MKFDESLEELGVETTDLLIPVWVVYFMPSGRCYSCPFICQLCLFGPGDFVQFSGFHNLSVGHTQVYDWKWNRQNSRGQVSFSHILFTVPSWKQTASIDDLWSLKAACLLARCSVCWAHKIVEQRSTCVQGQNHSLNHQLC